MSSDRQQMQVNKHNWYKIHAKMTFANIKTWTQYVLEKFQWEDYMNHISCHNEAIIW